MVVPLPRLMLCKLYNTQSIVFKQNQQDAALRNGIYYYTYNAVHVSGGSSAHHQELKTIYTASGICRASASYRYRE